MLAVCVKNTMLVTLVSLLISQSVKMLSWNILHSWKHTLNTIQCWCFLHISQNMHNLVEILNYFVTLFSSKASALQWKEQFFLSCPAIEVILCMLLSKLSLEHFLNKLAIFVSWSLLSSANSPGKFDLDSGGEGDKGEASDAGGSSCSNKWWYPHWQQCQGCHPNHWTWTHVRGKSISKWDDFFFM